MSQKVNEQAISNIASIGLLGVTLIVWTPGLTEPVGMPKLAILAPLAFLLLGLSLPGVKKNIGEKKLFNWLLFGFIALLGVSALFSANPLSRSIYGVEARNTGWLTYTSLSILMFVCMLLGSRSSHRKIYWTFLAAGIVNVLYSGLVLVTGKDPIPWNNVYGTILGTFGNPNFISSFLGFLSTALFIAILSPHRSLLLRIGSFLGIGVCIVEIIQTNSIQGMVVLALGIGLALGVFLKVTFNNPRITVIYLLTLFLSVLAGILGTLQKGPLSSILYKDSVSFRGEYWFAGLRMIRENPLFGLGPDSYGNWYRQYRDLSSTIRPGVETTANTAHNVFIDIGVSGGIPVLAIYLSLCVLVLIKIHKVFQKSSQFDPIFWTFAIVWICYQAQSLISINQIGLAIWGWVFAGLIVSYEFNSGEGSATHQLGGKTRKTKSATDSGAGVVFGAMGALVGILIVIPPISSDHAWRVGLQVSDANVLDRALEKWPRESNRLVIGSSIFANNNLNDFAIKFARLAVQHDPNNFDGWRILSKTKGATAEEIQKAKQEMKRLDPLNPELKGN